MLQRISRRLKWEWSRAALWLNDHPRRVWHDRFAAARLVPLPGEAAASDRVAILAIYPKAGIRPPHLRSLRQLQARGYAVFLVSNLPLSVEDLALVRPHVWLYATRPNFGYDIGAYRAAIRHLAATPEGLGGLKRLVLTNDSIWWPLGDAPDWLAVAEGMEAGAAGQGATAPDLIGAFTNLGITAAPIGTSQDWTQRADNPQFHYCSFALSLGPGLLADPGFLDFWQGMCLTDRKIEMVERGEVALTQWALSCGHSHAGTWDISGLPQRLAELDEPALRQLLAELIIPEDAPLRAVRRDMLGHPDRLPAKADLINALLGFIAATGPAYALPALIAGEPGAGLIKVSPLRLDPEGRAATLRVLSGDPELRREADAR